GPELEEALAELDADQLARLKQLLQPWPPASALLAPLRSESQRLGALVLYGGTHAHLFHPRDLPFIQALADLAAVAITETSPRKRDFYRPTRAELEPTNVNDVLLETIELVQTHLRHGGVVVSTTLDPNLPLIIAHSDQLRQVFLNLILNACDAMPDGGTLQITTELRPATPDQPAEIAIRVADTGVGIPPEHQPR